MTRDDIIRMAGEVGLFGLDECELTENFEHFALLVAAAEREACALEAETQAEDERYGHAKFRCANIAAAIRARGQS